MVLEKKKGKKLFTWLLCHALNLLNVQQQVLKDRPAAVAVATHFDHQNAEQDNSYLAAHLNQYEKIQVDRGTARQPEISTRANVLLRGNLSA